MIADRSSRPPFGLAFGPVARYRALASGAAGAARGDLLFARALIAR
jgi:hypothetical protein